MSKRSASNGPSDIDDHLVSLISDLRELMALLDRHGEEHWSRWAGQSLSEVELYDARGLVRLRQGYGGMGSFNDLVLDGGDARDRGRVNGELDALRTRIFEGVITLLHGAEDGAD